MDLQLAGKRVLVTGASKGIGLAIVRAFQAEGASVAATARRTTPELESTGAAFFAADLATKDGPRQLVEAVLASTGGLDVLVNNAGGGEMPDGVLTDTFNGGDEVWAAAFDLNLSAAVRVTRAALPALVATGNAAVVNISSDSARRVATDTPLPYIAAKAALNAFSRVLAERVAASGVRVNVVSPSATRTDILTSKDGYAARVADSLGIDHDTLLMNMPKQLGMLTETLIDPAEIARAVVLMASPAMPSTIGANWAIDAGATKVA
ncbi:SDR family oxidoreductase [Kibdelosporangium persicum]|uniref:Short-subunit dehydrogenase n=1 Tax=Kibdelosporangium persicum TaxID=2698649 RepID=A0ABX2F6G3_9PSEU|nr:SDR family NAD(P)-dependent oxidoreductase [Kibdelosporangium persicum]NRN66526.1 Short-subunit dehydrogenase [Kibdelosporangium persicum]